MIDLADFLEPVGSFRKHLTKPFLLDGYTVATNGAIVIFTKDECSPKPAGKCEIKAVEKMLSKMLSDCKAKQVDPIDILITDTKQTKCPLCDGNGTITVCYECGGKGELEFETDYNNYYVDCETCWGTGKLGGDDEMCNCCDGTGIIKDYAKINGGGWVDKKYIDQIAALGGRFLCQASDTQPAHFKIKSGFIVLMPVRIS